ncbi:MAG: hypothetical protein K8F91_23920 [Candidatus Obscuribacterales bacterium]|nr:hypothetical protein [Candidatus Obscuribacterales bacterium]
MSETLAREAMLNQADWQMREAGTRDNRTTDLGKTARHTSAPQYHLMNEIQPQLQKHFDYASKLAREGRHDLALNLFQDLAESEIEESSVLESADFLGQVYMRKAWTLMNLSRFYEAKETFESIFLKACLHQFSPNNKFAYFFSYANTLGELRALSEMEGAYVHSLRLAKQMKDPRRIQLCWLNLMYYAEYNQWWDYLEQASRTCIVFAESTGLDCLGLSAGIRRARALARLGQNDRADVQAKRTIQVALELGIDEALSAAQEFLNQLD